MQSPESYLARLNETLRHFLVRDQFEHHSHDYRQSETQVISFPFMSVRASPWNRPPELTTFVRSWLYLCVCSSRLSTFFSGGVYFLLSWFHLFFFLPPGATITAANDAPCHRCRPVRRLDLEGTSSVGLKRCLAAQDASSCTYAHAGRERF